MAIQETDVMSDHGLSEPVKSDLDGIKDIIDTVSNIYTDLGEIDLLNVNPEISGLCVKTGVACLHVIVVAKELRKKI